MRWGLLRQQKSGRVFLGWKDIEANGWMEFERTEEDYLKDGMENVGMVDR